MNHLQICCSFMILINNDSVDERIKFAEMKKFQFLKEVLFSLNCIVPTLRKGSCHLNDDYMHLIRGSPSSITFQNVRKRV